MRWTGYVARMGQVRNAYKIFVGNLNERDHSEELDVDGYSIICVLWIQGENVCTAYI
jgi:hypothetical protein